MQRSVSLKWSNLWVGLLIMIVVVIVIWASFSGGGTSIFEDKKKFTCYFANVDGLVVGSPIWMSGIEVGNVRSLKFVNLDSARQVEVVGAVISSVWPQVTDSSEVMLASIGFLGDKYIELTPGLGRGETIEEGGIVKTRDAGSVQAVFKEAEATAAVAGDLVGKLDTVLARVNRGQGTLGQLAVNDALYRRMTETLEALTKLTTDLQKNQERIVSSLEKTADAIASVSGKVDENTGTLGRFIADPALYDNLAATTAKLDTIMQKINVADGSLGLLVNDTALYSEITTLVTRVGNLIADMEANPRKYFKFSVF